MYQTPYDRRMDSGGGANAFKIFLILAFILFIVAIATPVSGGRQSMLTNADPNRDCGASTVALQGETIAAVAYRCNMSTTSILALNPGLGSADTNVSGQALVLAEYDPSNAALASNGQSVSNTVVQPEIVNVPATGNVSPSVAEVATVSQAGGGIAVVNPEVVYVPVSGGSVVVPQPQVVYVPVAQPQVVYVPVTGSAYQRAPVAYTVRTGDTLYSVARAYSTTVEAVMAANPGTIYSPDRIDVGQIIWIP